MHLLVLCPPCSETLPFGTLLSPRRDNAARVLQQRLIKLNQWLLTSTGSDWYRLSEFDCTALPAAIRKEFNYRARQLLDEQPAAAHLLLHDPRLCLLLPLWLPHLDNPHLLIATHQPLASAYLLRERYGFSLALGMALWEKYLGSALRDSAPLTPVTLFLEDLAAQPQSVAERLQHTLGLPLTLPDLTEFTSTVEPEPVDAAVQTALLTTAQQTLLTHLRVGTRPLPDPASDTALNLLLRDHERALASQHGEQHLNQALAARQAEIERLTQLADSFSRAADAAFGSLTWRLGYQVTDLARKLLLRPKMPMVQDFVRQLQDELLTWRNTRQHLHLTQRTRIGALFARRNGVMLRTAYTRFIQPLTAAAVADTVTLYPLTTLDELFHRPDLTAVLVQQGALEPAEVSVLLDHCSRQRLPLLYAPAEDSADDEAAALLTAHADVLLTFSPPQTGSAPAQVITLPLTLDETLWLDTRNGGFVMPEASAALPAILCLDSGLNGEQLPVPSQALAQLRQDYPQLVLDTVSTQDQPYPTLVRWLREHNRWQIGLLPAGSDPALCLEYAALGLATVAADSAPYRALLEPGQTGLLADSAADWYQALKTLIANSEQRRRLARQAFQTLTEQHLLRLHTEPYAAFGGPLLRQVWFARLCREMRLESTHWSRQPLISVVMPVYNIEVRWLERAVASVQNQIYPHWELCIADDASTRQETRAYLRSLDDPRIRVILLDNNQGIAGASNAALALAQGDYIALLDHDDELTANALFEVAKTINEHDPDLIYSDEDKLTLEGEPVEPHFKPDYSPDLIGSINYISHLGVYRKSLIDKIGGFRTGYDGSQDYDLLLRFLDHTSNVQHIPRVLYHWRKMPNSTAERFDSKSYAWDAGRRALAETLQRRGIDGTAEFGPFPGTYRVKRTIQNEPLVSILIPFKDKPELLQQCLDSILDKSTYSRFEIIGLSNNSVEAETLALMADYAQRDPRIRFVRYDHPFNFSAINNYGAELAQGEHLLLLNNDITVISPDWIEALLEHSQRPEVGAVGAKLYYPDDTLQHAGVILRIGGIAGHSHKYLARNTDGYFARPCLIQNLSAVTAACLMVRKSVYASVGGLNADHLTIAFNDVDFCLRLREAGYLNIFTPYCEMYHHESKSRGQEDTPAKQARFAREAHYMRTRHAAILKAGDPYYNPNLSLTREDFSLRPGVLDDPFITAHQSLKE